MRVLAASQLTEEKKTELKALHERLNPFKLHRDIQRQMKQINSFELELKRTMREKLKHPENGMEEVGRPLATGFLRPAEAGCPGNTDF
ncbi:MAG: hypothetical protein N2689_01810 [Verrucomicrobiae bacterium]|nr:hypothetical protein [Verrucomicrobiae bacterium]